MYMHIYMHFNTDYSKESTVNSGQSQFLSLALGTGAKHPPCLLLSVQNSITLSKFLVIHPLAISAYPLGGSLGAGARPS